MNILIVEDEPQTAKLLQEIILQLQPQSHQLGILDSIEGVVRYLSGPSVQPDLIFMDIQLADGLSFDIFSFVRVNCPVVFCTAYDQYSLQAFKANGIEYLLKPVKVEDVRAAFDKLETLKGSLQPNEDWIRLLKQAVQPSKSYRKSILVPHRENFIPIPVSEVAVFHVEDEHLRAYLFDQSRHALFVPLSDMERELDPEHFFRINRQAIVNRAAVLEIKPYFNRKISLKTPVKLPETLVVSRLKVTEFMQWMER